MKMAADPASGLLDQDILQDHYIIANSFNGESCRRERLFSPNIIYSIYYKISIIT